MALPSSTAGWRLNGATSSAATRIFRRVWRLYAAYVVLFVIYIDTIAYVASQSMAPEIIHEYNISGILEHPLRILVRGLVLQEEPLNLDLLQLMIPLMAFFPLRAVGSVAAAEPDAGGIGRAVCCRTLVRLEFSGLSGPGMDLQSAVLADADGAGRLVRRDRRASGASLRGMPWLRILAGAYLVFAMAITLMRHSPAMSAYLPDIFLDSIGADRQGKPRALSRGALPRARLSGDPSHSGRSSRPAVEAASGSDQHAARNGSPCSASACSCPSPAISS